MEIVKLISVQQANETDCYNVQFETKLSENADAMILPFYLSPIDTHGLASDMRTAVEDWIAADNEVLPVPVQPRDVAAETSEHGLFQKMTLVNATRTDGVVDAITHEALATISMRYRDIALSCNTKAALEQTLTDEEKALLQRIATGFDYFEAVDQAAATINAAGDAAGPIDTDPRWPVVPGT